MPAADASAVVSSQAPRNLDMDWLAILGRLGSDTPKGVLEQVWTTERRSQFVSGGIDFSRLDVFCLACCPPLVWFVCHAHRRPERLSTEPASSDRTWTWTRVGRLFGPRCWRSSTNVLGNRRMGNVPTTGAATFTLDFCDGWYDAKTSQGAATSIEESANKMMQEQPPF